MKPLNHSLQNCKLFRIDWSVIETWRPELDPKWTRLWDLMPIGSSWWRHFRCKCKDYWGYAVLNFEAASFSSLRENQNQPFMKPGNAIWAQFRGQLAKMSNRTHKRKRSPWITVSNTVNFLRICWTIIEKLPPEHGPKWTRLCDLLPTGSSWRCHFRWKCRDYRGRCCVKIFEVNSVINFRDIKIIISWRRRRRRHRDSIWRRRIRVSLTNSLNLLLFRGHFPYHTIPNTIYIAPSCR